MISDTMTKKGIWIFEDSEEFMKVLKKLQKEYLENKKD